MKRVSSLITDSMFIVLAVYFVCNYARMLFVFPHSAIFFFVYQTFFFTYQILALGLFLTRNRLVDSSPRIVDYFYTFVALATPMFFRPVLTIHYSILGGLFVVAGAVLVIGSFLSLNRSFGIAPENRGIKETGMYRLLRHPMYSGYLLAETGFVISNFSAFNVTILITAAIFLVLRLQAEERLLTEDKSYRTYSQQTRWKLIPYVL